MIFRDVIPPKEFVIGEDIIRNDSPGLVFGTYSATPVHRPDIYVIGTKSISGAYCSFDMHGLWYSLFDFHDDWDTKRATLKEIISNKALRIYPTKYVNLKIRE